MEKFVVVFEENVMWDAWDYVFWNEEEGWVDSVQDATVFDNFAEAEKVAATRFNGEVRSLSDWD